MGRLGNCSNSATWARLPRLFSQEKKAGWVSYSAVEGFAVEKM